MSQGPVVEPKRDRYEPSDKKVPTWALSVEEFTKLSCRECGQKFEADAARGVRGGLTIVDDNGEKKYYHGYPESPRYNDCNSRAAKKGYP